MKLYIYICHMRKKIILNGFEQWVEFDRQLCLVTIYGSETAKHGIFYDVFGSGTNLHVGKSGWGGNELVNLTEQERTELNNHINNLK